MAATRDAKNKFTPAQVAQNIKSIASFRISVMQKRPRAAKRRVNNERDAQPIIFEEQHDRFETYPFGAA